MWVSKKDWDALNKRLDETYKSLNKIENQRTNDYGRGDRVVGHDWFGVKVYEMVTPKQTHESLKSLLDHLGLEIVNEPEKTVIRKKGATHVR